MKRMWVCPRPEGGGSTRVRRPPPHHGDTGPGERSASSYKQRQPPWRRASSTKYVEHVIVKPWFGL
eukprot:6055958-Prymnesium_polylepis.1